MNELVSIITPCKNAERWLEACFESIKNQSYSNWELIIIDDSSTDNSYNILESLAKSDSRVKVFKNPDQGIIAALNKGLQSSTGSFIARMDADDLMPSQRIEKMVSRLQTSPDKTVVTGLVSYFSDSEVSEGYQSYEKWINEVNASATQWKSVYRECVIASPNWMIRRNDFLSIGGFADLDYPEDYDLVFKWYQHQFQVECIEEVTLFWREHPDRTSRNSDHYQQQAFFELKLKRFIELDYKGGPLVIWGDNVKSKLAETILMKHGITPIVQNLNEYLEIKHLQSPQLLIAVWPDEKQRDQIEKFLKSSNLNQGFDWWWL